MRVILYFGSFNPIHNGHINAAINAMNKIGAYKVIFIPSFESFDNKQDPSYFINAIDRLNMIKETIKNINGFDVSDYEIKQQRKVYTIETLEYMVNQYYRDNIYILMGYDQVKDFFLWKDANKILKLSSVIAYKRGNVVIDKSKYSTHDFLFLDDNANNISSTWIRQNKLIDFLPIATLNYINNHGLYIDKRLLSFISNKRFQHSLRVALMTYETMQIYDPENSINGWVAGAYHDICKELGEQQTLKLINKYHLESNLSWKVMHGPIAKEFLKEMFKFNNQLVLNAIANHTVPNTNTNLTVLDKVLFCCDKLEPNRTNADVRDINYYRELLKKDFDKCFNELYEYQKQLFSKKPTDKLSLLDKNNYEYEISKVKEEKEVNSKEKNKKNNTNKNVKNTKKAGKK